MMCMVFISGAIAGVALRSLVDIAWSKWGFF